MHGVGEEKVTKCYCHAAKELHTPACIFFYCSGTKVKGQSKVSADPKNFDKLYLIPNTSVINNNTT